MAKKSKASPKVKRGKTKKHPKRLSSEGATASVATLKGLEKTWHSAKLRVGNTNKGLNEAIKEAEEFKFLNPRAFKLAMKFMTADPFRARNDMDDLEVYLDLLGFNARKPKDLFKDHAPKADKKGKRDSGGLVPIGEAVNAALANAKPKADEPPSNVLPLRAAE